MSVMNTPVDLYPVIVAYNRKLRENENFKNLIHSFNPEHITVADNSSDTLIAQDNKTFCSECNVKYISMNGNAGLPKAYNTAINTIPESENNYVLILDQDTKLQDNLDKAYIEAVNNEANKKIFCPVIYDAKGIMSPCTKKGKGYIHSQPAEFNQHTENYSYINSCMCINRLVFNKVKYDEKLFLDFVDHDFVMNARKQLGNVFYVMPQTEIYQEFSGVTKNSLESDIARFKILVKDQTYFYRKNYGSTKYANRKLFLRALKLNVMHRTLKFFTLLKHC